MVSTLSEMEIARFLGNPDVWGSGVDQVETVNTHISRIFLGGDRVLKLKRHVRFPYLDFSTAERRRLACEAEIAVNRRTAPGIYKRAIALTRDTDGQLSIDGEGEAVDWLVEMARFDQDTLFDRMAKAGKLNRPLMEQTAEVISRFHETADIMPGGSGRAIVQLILDSNKQCFLDLSPMYFAPEPLRVLSDLYERRMKDLGDLLDQRRDGGLVRHCHGDLHLRNICLLDGTPILFDAIEFNQDFTNIDILYDLAFLLMDLEFVGHRRFANIVLNRYFDVNGRGNDDVGNFQVLSLFLSMRAAVRAHVDAMQARSLDDPLHCQKRAKEAQSYFAMAVAYLTPRPPRLIAVGGLSGSGKSRMARELAPSVGAAPGARVVRTDVTRKRLAGSDLQDRLGADGYSAEMTARTYEAFCTEIRKCLCEGQSVVADAVFAREPERQQIAAIAAELAVPFDGLWLEAPKEVMIKRVTERKNNVSDAGRDVVDLQLGYDLGKIAWRRVDSSGPREQTITRGIKALGL